MRPHACQSPWFAHAQMELLVRHGANVNAAWHDVYPVVFAPCETLDPIALDWLLQHGADPDCGKASEWQSKGQPHPGTALDFVLGNLCPQKMRWSNASI